MKESEIVNEVRVLTLHFPLSSLIPFPTEPITKSERTTKQTMSIEHLSLS